VSLYCANERLAFGSGRGDPRACFSLAARGSAGAELRGERPLLREGQCCGMTASSADRDHYGLDAQSGCEGYCEVDLHDSDQLSRPIYVIEAFSNEKNNRDSIRMGLS